jgi:hypothetical protein
MTCWGFAPSGTGALPEDLARFGGGAFGSSTVAAERKTEEERRRLRTVPVVHRADRGALLCLLPLLPLLLLLLLLLLLFVPFGAWRPLVSPPGFEPGFRLPALPWSEGSDAERLLTELRNEASGLRADLEKLRSDLKATAELCVPEAADALRSPLTEPPNPAERGRQELIIPETAKGFAFLKGRWVNDAGLVNKEDQQPITVIYAFDESGNGTVSVQQAGKRDCVGKAAAGFVEAGVLRIETERQICPGEDRSYAAEIIECVPAAGGVASCLGKSAEGKTWGGSVYFKRLQ